MQILCFSLHFNVYVRKIVCKIMMKVILVFFIIVSQLEILINWNKRKIKRKKDKEMGRRNCRKSSVGNGNPPKIPEAYEVLKLNYTLFKL